MTLRRRTTLTATLGLALLPELQAQPASSSAIAIERFFEPAQLSQATLNPAGTHVALCVGGDGAKRRLVVLELASMKVTPVAAFKEADVSDAVWINDRRLYVGSHDESRDRDNWRSPLGYAVDVDGGNFRRLGHRHPGLHAAPGLGDDLLFSYPADQSEGWGHLKLQRLNTRNGAAREVDLPPWTQSFVVDSGGEPVAAVTARGDKEQLRWRGEAKSGAEWRVLSETDRFFGASVMPWQYGPDGKLYVVSRRDKDLAVLYTLDPVSAQISDRPVLALAQFDIAPQLLWHKNRLVGAQVRADARTTVWFDEVFKAVQAKIDAKLPATTNLLQIPQQGDSPWVLVVAYSDTRPMRAFAYHREADKLTLLGNARSKIDPATQSGMDFLNYKARDGRVIPAYLTLPRSAGPAPKKLPLVVWVHGGPFVRGGDWEWHPEVQFLASRGYAVLQPEFRGSDGFGDTHLRAGFQQWGLAMQDDLADGVEHLVRQGTVDPQRVAILGGSYGGYAAMMGLVRHPELYRCAINYVGVTDLNLLATATWDDISPIFKRLGVTKVIGDPLKDAERFLATSPIHQAGRIGQPVLLAYGRYDQRVPIEHGERMRDALKGHNKDLEWVLYDHEGHGWYWQDNVLDFWGRVERFLARHMTPKA